MIDTNTSILNFLADNYLLIILILLLIIKIVPPEWAGFWKYNDNNPASGRAKKINILKFIIDGVLDGIVNPLWVHVSVIFGFNKVVTILIFTLVLFAVFVMNQISGTVVTLISIGIISLYLERLIETGKTIRLFGNLINWERKD
jgi:hypothetical protein